MTGPFLRTYPACAARVLASVLFVASSAAFGAQVHQVVVDHAFVQNLAAERARSPFKPRPSRTPKFLRELTYDEYFKIEFINEHSLWREDGLPFRVQFFHPGYAHSDGVAINEFSGTHVQRLPFLRTSYNYHDLELKGRLPGSLEYAGFRVLHPLNQAETWDETLSFLGASYFRALGQRHRYGMSARGLALNSGGPDPEEFPVFNEFWLGKPAADAKSLTIHALMDSKSVTGAYTFILTPGPDTLMEVQATLNFRAAISRIGYAPLTSMFWYGENSEHRFSDFRPEVHDSDGLLIAPEADVRIWRPLNNPEHVRLTHFDTPALQGFGLLQRDRDYVHYEDLQARYEHRPGVWVEPGEPWPPGKVTLLELPTINEYQDNIGAVWTPREPPPLQTPIRLSWRLHWTAKESFGGPSGWVRATRQTLFDGGMRRTMFVIDFASAGLEAIPASADVEAEVVAPGLNVISKVVTRSEIDGSWRLALRLEAPPEIKGTVELRARLLLEGKPVTETWVNPWTPKSS